MKLRNSFLARSFYLFLEKSIIPKLADTAVTPNHFTLTGFMLALLVPFGFYCHPFWGLFFMLLSGASDVLDGLMARSQDKTTIIGAFLDSSLDRFSDFCFIFGFWVLFWETDHILLASAVIFITMFLTFFISYIKARASSVGIETETGLMERGLRTVYLMVWAFILGLFPSAANRILWTGLVLFCGLCLYTIVQRLGYVVSALKSKNTNE